MTTAARRAGGRRRGRPVRGARRPRARRATRVPRREELVVVAAYPYAPLSSRILDGPTDAAGAARALDEARRALGRRAAELRHRARLEPWADVARGGRGADAAVIVVGSSRHGPTGRLVLGGVTAETLRRAPCAVGVAPRGWAAGARSLNRIGVAVDGSERDRSAVAVARRLADLIEPRATVRTIHVETAVPGTRRGHDVEASVHLEGEPADALAAHSAELDLLVLGSRGRERAGAVVLGSVAARLIGMARCPVLALPAASPRTARSPVSVISEWVSEPVDVLGRSHRLLGRSVELRETHRSWVQEAGPASTSSTSVSPRPAVAPARRGRRSTRRSPRASSSASEPWCPGRCRLGRRDDPLRRGEDDGRLDPEGALRHEDVGRDGADHRALPCARRRPGRRAQLRAKIGFLRAAQLTGDAAKAARCDALHLTEVADRAHVARSRAVPARRLRSSGERQVDACVRRRSHHALLMRSWAWRASTALRNGSVVVDATFGDPALRDAFLEACRGPIATGAG